MKKIAIFCLFVLLSTGMALGAVDNNKSQELTARYSYIACRVTLIQSQATLLNPFGNISGIDNITSDFAKLQTLADSSTPDSFNAQVQIINKDFKTVNDELKTAKQTFSKSNISQTDRDTLKSAWNNTLQTYQSCNIAARRDIVTVRVANLQASIDNWNAIIVNMTAKGLDTTTLTAVVSDAQKLLSSLQATIQAPDDTTFKTLLDNANDEQDHLWARFAIGRIDSNIAHIEPIIGQTNQSNLSGYFDQINSLLSNSSNLATPGHKYGDGEFQQTWQNIKDASNMLNTLSKDVRSFEQAARQNGRFGNNTNPRNLTNRPMMRANSTPRGNITGPRNFTRPPRGNITGPRLGPGGNYSGPGDNATNPLDNTQGDGQ